MRRRQRNWSKRKEIDSNWHFVLQFIEKLHSILRILKKDSHIINTMCESFLFYPLLFILHLGIARFPFHYVEELGGYVPINSLSCLIVKSIPDYVNTF